MSRPPPESSNPRGKRRAGTLASLAALAAALPGGGAARAEPPPAPVTAMLEAAAATGSAETLKTVADLAKKTNPASRAEIDAQVAALKAKQAQARVDKINHQTLLQAISGEVQVGFSNSSGDSNTINLALGLKLSAETRRWKQTFAATGDFERENGVTSREEETVAYQARYKLSPRFYALGALSWDRDPFDGYTSRGSLSVGLGYMIINRPTLTLSLDGGPAVRRIDYVATASVPATTQTSGAARAAAVLTWTIAPKTVFSQDVVAFAQPGDSTVISLTSLSANLAGSLSARLSFKLQHDTRLPPGFDHTDTLSRVTLVYGFR